MGASDPSASADFRSVGWRDNAALPAYGNREETTPMRLQTPLGDGKLIGVPRVANR